MLFAHGANLKKLKTASERARGCCSEKSRSSTRQLGAMSGDEGRNQITRPLRLSYASGNGALIAVIRAVRVARHRPSNIAAYGRNCLQRVTSQLREFYVMMKGMHKLAMKFITIPFTHGMTRIGHCELSSISVLVKVMIVYRRL